jgi:hypothetical protein
MGMFDFLKPKEKYPFGDAIEDALKDINNGNRKHAVRKIQQGLLDSIEEDFENDDDYN